MIRLLAFLFCSFVVFLLGIGLCFNYSIVNIMHCCSVDSFHLRHSKMRTNRKYLFICLFVSFAIELKGNLNYFNDLLVNF